jgi:flagellin
MNTVSAADDAAGVAIASRLSAEIRGTNMAIRNAMDGQAMLDTAEGAHQEVEFLLQRMRELAVQAANDTNGSSDRNNLQAEVNALTAEINRIAEVTTWAGQALLTGSGGNSSNGTFVFQVGSRTSASDRITATINAMSAAALGVGEGNIAVSADASTLAEVGNNVLQVGGTPRDGDIFSFTVGGKDLQVKIVDADATNLTFRVSVDGGTTFTDLSGANADQTATGNGVAGAADAIKRAINNYTTSDYIGLTATAGADGSVTVSQAINISASSFTDTAGSPVTGPGTLNSDGNVLTFAAIDGEEGVSFTINGHAVSTITTASVAADEFADTVDGLVARINSELALAANADKFGGLSVEAAKAGANITITVTAATTTLLEDAAANPASATTALSVATAADARDAIEAIDTALQTVNTQRANLGAISNRLDSTVKNLTNISTNLQAGRGRIEDADFASETTNLAKSQILQQAAMAMLAQANASKQGVLSLLQR